jgi:hypothetical protein
VAAETVAVAVVKGELKKAFKDSKERARAEAALNAVAKDPAKAAALSAALDASADGTAEVDDVGGGGTVHVPKQCVAVTKTTTLGALVHTQERIVIQKEVWPLWVRPQLNCGMFLLFLFLYRSRALSLFLASLHWLAALLPLLQASDLS